MLKLEIAISQDRFQIKFLCQKKTGDTPTTSDKYETNITFRGICAAMRFMSASLTGGLYKYGRLFEPLRYCPAGFLVTDDS